MPVTTAKEIVLVRDPDIPDDQQLTDRIALATARTGDEWGDQKNEAIALQVLHMYALDSRGSAASGGGIAGPLTGEKEGRVSRQYGGSLLNSLSAKDIPWAQTSYGLEYLALRRMCIMGVRTRNL